MLCGPSDEAPRHRRRISSLACIVIAIDRNIAAEAKAANPAVKQAICSDEVQSSGPCSGAMSERKERASKQKSSRFKLDVSFHAC